MYHKRGPLYLHDLSESHSNARRYMYGRNDRRLVQPKCQESLNFESRVSS